MEYVLICSVALVVSALTLFSGFGLGTLLLPAFAVFFPIELAVAATAIVHLANNIFKLVLVGRGADWAVVKRFAIVAALAAFGGAALLGYVSQVPPILIYTIGETDRAITPVKLVISVLIAMFAVMGLGRRFDKLAFSARLIPLGGAISGFFGGLSGHQGALRSAFLVRAGLDKARFIATMVVCAAVVDVARLAVYGSTFVTRHLLALRDEGGLGLVAAGCVAAFAGASVGKRLVAKVTMRTVRLIVGVMLLLMALGLGSGLI